MKSSKTYLAVPPGETIKEQLEISGITEKELACLLGVSEVYTADLLKGDILLTEDIAKALEGVLGVSEGFWLNLESNYRNMLQLIQSEIREQDN